MPLSNWFYIQTFPHKAVVNQRTMFQIQQQPPKLKMISDFFFQTARQNGFDYHLYISQGGKWNITFGCTTAVIKLAPSGTGCEGGQKNN